MMRTIAAGVCVGICAVAAFMTQGSANRSNQAVEDVNHALVQLQAVGTCNKRIMKRTLIALNERSTFTKATAEANIDLQQSMADFFGILLHRPPYSEAKRTHSAFDYYGDLQHFLQLTKKGRDKITDNPFPKIRDYNECLQKEESNAE